MNEREMSKEEFNALLDAEIARGRKELQKYLRKARAAPLGDMERLRQALERHEAVMAEVERHLHAKRAARRSGQ